MRLNLKKFDPQSMVQKDGRIIFVIGRRGSGKSTLLRYLMYELRSRYDFVIGMSPTRSSIEMMEEHMPYAMIFDEGFSPEQFAKMISLCCLLAKKHKLRNGLLVLDDCNADKEAFKSKTMRDAFMNGRHYGMNILWAMHYCMDILPALRSQVDYVFVLKDNIRKNKERLYLNFFGMFEKLEDFVKVMDQCTENNECLVLDNTNPNPQPDKCLFWYKAKEAKVIPSFQLGKPVFFKLSAYYKNKLPQDEDLLRITIPRPGQIVDHCNFQTLLFSNPNNPRIEAVSKQDYVEPNDAAQSRQNHGYGQGDIS